jgi:hypothetical protein
MIKPLATRSGASVDISKRVGAIILMMCTLDCGVTFADSKFDLDKAVTIPIIKQEYPGNPKNIDQLYINIISIGTKQVNTPIMIATGSAGMTTECETVLPRQLCSVNGIKIDKETTIDNIRITTNRAVADYGTYSDYGNIAFANVTIGSPMNAVSIAQPIPILIRYKMARRLTGQVVGGPLWPKGIFGIALATSEAQGQLTSPLLAVRTANGLDKGYIIGEVGDSWTTCVANKHSCPNVSALTVGLDSAHSDGFKKTKLDQTPTKIKLPLVPTCIKWQDNEWCKPTLFDTGNSTVAIDDPGVSFKYKAVPTSESIKVTSPIVGQWDFKTRYSPEVEIIKQSDPMLNFFTLGMRFFEKNKLLVDYDTSELGVEMHQ